MSLGELLPVFPLVVFPPSVHENRPMAIKIKTRERFFTAFISFSFKDKQKYKIECPKANLGRGNSSRMREQFKDEIWTYFELVLVLKFYSPMFLSFLPNSFPILSLMEAGSSVSEAPSASCSRLISLESTKAPCMSKVNSRRKPSPTILIS